MLVVCCKSATAIYQLFWYMTQCICSWRVSSLMTLMLFHFIYVNQYFTLRFFNHRIASFSYSYLDKENKPECIDKCHIYQNSLQQTAASTSTLCFTLPFIVGHKIPQSDETWGNILRLIQIMLLSISPSVTRETVSIIEPMISIYHTKFRHLYPKAAVTPNMHFMVHLPSPMRLYGPQRSAWCMRFEAKHSTFKGRKWRNSQNLSFSVASFHQKLMCAQQMSGLKRTNDKFLYSGDETHGTDRVKLATIYPALCEMFSQQYAENRENPCVYTVDRLMVHGHSYISGCALVIGYDGDDFPEYGILRGMFTFEDVKYFVIEKTSVQNFDEHKMAYVISCMNEMSVLSHPELYSKWPLSVYTVDQSIDVVNKYSHTVVFP